VPVEPHFRTASDSKQEAEGRGVCLNARSAKIKNGLTKSKRDKEEKERKELGIRLIM
jgi:hypothetical protein